MQLQRRFVSVLFILILITLTFFIYYGRNDMHPEKALKRFSTEIKNENLVRLNLTIYYLSPHILTLYPYSVDDLTNRSYEYKIDIDGSRLEEHIDLFKKINSEALIPVEHKSRINARICFVIKNNKGQKILEVAMWGDDESIFVNGVEIIENELFYTVVLQFLPEDIMSELEAHLTGKGD